MMPKRPARPACDAAASRRRDTTPRHQSARRNAHRRAACRHDAIMTAGHGHGAADIVGLMIS